MKKTPSLPAELVTIGAYDYRLEVMDPAEADEHDKLGDWQYHPDCRIRIDTRRGYRKAAATLDHEIAHGVVYESGAVRRISKNVISWARDHPNPTEEEQAEFRDALEELLIEVTFEAAHPWRRHNPVVERWIQRGLERG